MATINGYSTLDIQLPPGARYMRVEDLQPTTMRMMIATTDDFETPPSETREQWLARLESAIAKMLAEGTP